MCELSHIEFHGDTIYYVEIDGQPFTPMKPIIENLGMDRSAQATKIRANKERWGVAMIAIPSKSGEQETLCLPLRKLPAYLAGINPKKVKPELREKIELYQAECDDALWNYWMNDRAGREKKAPASSTERVRKCRERKKLAQSQFSLACGKDEFEVWLNELESCRAMIHNKILEPGHKGASLAGDFSDKPFNYGLYAVITKWVVQAVISPHKIQNEKWEDPYAIVRILRILKQTT